MFLGVTNNSNHHRIHASLEKSSSPSKPAIQGHEKLFVQKENQSPEELKNVKTTLVRQSALPNVKFIPYNLTTLKTILKSGDILLSYFPQNSNGLEFFNRVDATIRLGQIFAKLYSSHSSEISHNFVHAGLYVGGSTVAEAIGKGLKQTGLQEKRLKLLKGMNCGYLVVRPANKEIAHVTTCLARMLATPTEAESHYNYSKQNAALAALGNSELGKEGLKRYLMGFAFAFTNTKPMNPDGSRDFFCSHFVVWTLQAAEAFSIFSKINQQTGQEILVPFIDQDLSDREKYRLIEEWALKTVENHYDLIISFIKINLDAQFTTPQRLFSFIQQNPDLFQMKYMIVPPTE